MRSVVLNDNGRKIFSCLSSFPDFYLAGGTALALQIGHRQSSDFDLFSDSEIPDSLLTKTKRIFAEFSPILPLVNNPDELTVSVGDTKVTFLRYPFPVLRDFVELERIKILSIPEIAATKAYTIGRRGSFRDYVDLYYILSEQHTSLMDVIDLAQKKYGREFNSRLLLEQLIYLEDIQDTEVLFLGERVEKEKIQSFFEDAIKKFSVVL